MATGQSSRVVLASAGATAALTVFKYVAAAFSGSAGLLAEAVHSTVDTGNSLLMYFGQRRSAKPPDDLHPFGYGMELYFWTLVVALVMFAVGGVVTVAEGVARILHPEELGSPGWGYAVLAASALFNGYTWVVAVREFRAGQGGKGFWRALEHAKDPTTLTVLFEDTASLLGLLAAFLGLLLSQLLENPVFDGAASVVIGLLLGAVGAGLVWQCKTLIVGESATAEVKDSVSAIATGDGAVERVTDLRTMHLGPRDVLVNMRVRFRDDLPARAVGEAVDRLERAIRDKHPEFRRVYIAPAARDR